MVCRTEKVFCAPEVDLTCLRRSASLKHKWAHRSCPVDLQLVLCPRLRFLSPTQKQLFRDGIPVLGVHLLKSSTNSRWQKKEGSAGRQWKGLYLV
jgi:hypothetical protein